MLSFWPAAGPSRQISSGGGGKKKKREKAEELCCVEVGPGGVVVWGVGVIAIFFKTVVAGSCRGEGRVYTAPNVERSRSGRWVGATYGLLIRKSDEPKGRAGY